ncbi:MAG: endonuclease/exonuclease/phosphatase family protein [Gemmatimonadetes bacterium]|nr:endonuclease/exonuclease/phosphatase family protein [Gemmatimonadota bacterium]
MNLNTWADGREVLTDVARLNELLSRKEYKGATKTAIKKLLDKYEFWNRKKTNRPFDIREVREKLFKVPKGKKAVEIVAKGRGDWVGWVELRRDEISSGAVVNTGRVIDAVGPQLLCMIEVDDRIALDRFNTLILDQEFGRSYEYNMLVDGNDPRRIDIGLLSQHEIVCVRSHIHDRDGGPDPIFSRDCPEFEIRLPGGETLWLLGNHFKSKGYGDPKASNARRRRQAEKVAEIYHEARKRSDHVVVAGDLNDFPTSWPLQPLVAGTDLKDVMSHPSYTGLPGTFGTGKSPNQKLDYILLSPVLFAKVQRVGVERRGVYAPKTHPSFPEVTSAQTSASDHACVWVDLDLS